MQDKPPCVTFILIFETPASSTGTTYSLPFSFNFLRARLLVATFCRVFMQLTTAARDSPLITN
jgi:hypothetical protein